MTETHPIGTGERLKRLEAYAREASIALMAISGGGSEMFKRIGEEFYAEPDLCLARYREKMEMRQRRAALSTLRKDEDERA